VKNKRERLRKIAAEIHVTAVQNDASHSVGLELCQQNDPEIGGLVLEGRPAQ
jgi:hypothetical protein